MKDLKNGLFGAHRKQFWMPDIPGHKRKKEITVSSDLQDNLDNQIDRLRLELNVPTSESTANKEARR